MPRHLTIEWPDRAPFRDRDGAPIRILAVSDQMDPALEDVRNRPSFGRIDLIVGCGDLPGEDLCFVADLIDAPLMYVRGNHDGGRLWKAAAENLPDAIESTAVHHESGLAVAGLAWPGERGVTAMRSETGAWQQAIRLAVRCLGHSEPLLIISHMPPLGSGDIESSGDAESNGYHRGFRGYRWLMRRIEPPLWLHGHTPLAACRDWALVRGKTTVVNVSGAVLIELHPPASSGPTAGGARPAGGGPAGEDCPD
jgi:hypothetical protein